MFRYGKGIETGERLGHPPTDIQPWDPEYTQEKLSQAIYFDKLRQQNAVAEGDLLWFVVLCNDKQPGFESLGNHQYVKRGAYPGVVPVDPIFIFRNPMPTR